MSSINGGACDGWLRAGSNDEYAIGYYVKKDLPFFADAAPRWTVCDRYFSAIMAGTFANRVYQHAAQTDRLANTFELSTLPTIWDRLAGAGLEGRYYFSDLPFLALWGSKYVDIARPVAAFFADAAAGTLPAGVVRRTALPWRGGRRVQRRPSVRGHPQRAGVHESGVFSRHHGAGVGQHRVRDQLRRVGRLLRPCAASDGPIPPADQAAGNEDGLLGFRTPCLVISPFAQREHVSRLTLDHTSVLKMIEWRWGLEPLTVRDAGATNLAEVLQFRGARPDREAAGGSRRGRFGQLCVPGLPDATDDEWLPLLEMAADFGWPVGAGLPV